jgi:hypothetical protein
MAQLSRWPVFKALLFAAGVVLSGTVLAQALVVAERPGDPLQPSPSPGAAPGSTPSSRAAVTPPTRRPDLRLLLDSSGEALRLDPENTRAVAVTMMVRALPEGSMGGIWTYATHSDELVAHGRVDEAWKRSAQIGVAALPSEGGQEGFTDALQSATWDFGDASGRERHIVIISAGDVPAGESDEASAAASLFLGNFAEQLSASGMRTHVIVLPGGKASSHLRQLAVQTGGMFLEAVSTEDLGALFGRVVDFTSLPPAIPVDDGGFTVDAGVRELSLRIAGDDPKRVLVDPDGKVHSRPKPGSRVRWHDARGFDLITIKRPRPGRWELRGGQDATLFAWGDLALRVERVPAVLFPGTMNTVDFMLFDGDRPVDDPHFHDLATATARLVGEGEDLPLYVSSRGRGLYRVEMVNEARVGRYVLEVRVDGPTFARKATVPFELMHPIRVHVAQRGKDVVAWLELGDSSIDYGSLKVAAQYRMPPDPRTLVPARRMPGGLWQLTVPNVIDAVEIAWSVSGRYQNRKKFELHTEPQRVDVPLEAEVVTGFDATGHAVDDMDPARRLLPYASAERAQSEVVLSEPLPSSEPELPIWFVIMIAVVNISLAGGGAWFILRRAPNADLQAWLEARAASPPQPS